MSELGALCKRLAFGVTALPRSRPKLTEFHLMKLGATPARLVAVVQAADEQAALEDAIKRHAFRRTFRNVFLSSEPREGRDRCREKRGIATSARSSGRKTGHCR